MTVLPLFPLALCGLCPLHANGAVGTVFRPVRFRQIVATAEDAFFSICPVEQGSAQASVQWQNSGAEPFADQRVCDALRADTFLRAERPDGQHDMSVSESIPAIKPIPASSEPNAFSVSISPSRTSSMAQVSQYRENRKAASALFFLLCQPAAFLSCREILEDRLCRVLV